MAPNPNPRAGPPPPPKAPSGAAGGPPIAPPAPVSVLAPFTSRDFRFQWPADLLTALAFEMEILILGWYVLVTTESVFWLTAMGALHYFGTLLSPGIGVLADRIGLRNTLCLMRAFYAAMAGLLAFLFLTDQASLVLVFAVASLLGAIRPSDIGMRTALVAQLIPAPQLSGAGAFAAFGIGPAYLLVTLAYAMGCLLTLAIRPPAKPKATDQEPPAPRRSPFGDLLDGLAYVWLTPHILAAMLLACLVNFTAIPQCVGLLPHVAKNIYGIDQTGLGLLTACFAFGALCGSILLAVLRNRVPSGRLMMSAAILWHMALIAFAFATTQQVGMALLWLAGFLQSLSLLSLISVLLKTADRAMLGRVMGVRMLAIYSLPVGLILAGILVPAFGFAATAAGYAATGLVLTLTITIVWRQSLWSASAPANS